MFRRRKRGSGVDEVDEELAAASGHSVREMADRDEADEADDAVAAEENDDTDEADEADETETDDAGGTGAVARPTGPFDLEDLPDDGLVRLDLGSLRVPGLEGLDINVNVDEPTGTVIGVTVMDGASALQLQAFAAPRNEGIWADVRREIAAQITKDGGLADVQETADGGTLRTRLPVAQPDGTSALAPVRFIGTDGPRWLLRGVLSGPAVDDPAVAGRLLTVYRGTVVVRGSDPFAPRDPLPLRLPDGLPPEMQPEGARTEPLDISGTGQHITEIR